MRKAPFSQLWEEMSMKNYLMIGQIVKPQGVRGEVKVLPLTDDPERYGELETVYFDEKGEKSAKVLSARVREGFAYVALEGVSDRDAAERLRNQALYVDRAHAAPLRRGERAAPHERVQLGA